MPSIIFKWFYLLGKKCVGARSKAFVFFIASLANESDEELPTKKKKSDKGDEETPHKSDSNSPQSVILDRLTKNLQLTGNSGPAINSQKEDKSHCPQCIASNYIIKVSLSHDHLISKWTRWRNEHCTRQCFGNQSCYICIASIPSIFLNSRCSVYHFLTS